MAGRSLGTVQNSNGDGLDPLSHRQILKGLYPTPGVITGLNVSGNNNLTYHVNAGVGVSQRSSSDGSRLFYFSGGNTAAVPAGDPSNSRIDIVWVKCQDPSLDSNACDVIVGVTSGTPSTRPVAPTLPQGVTELRRFTVAPNTTNLSNGAQASGTQVFSVPYGANMGQLVHMVNTYDSTAAKDDKWYVEGSVQSFYVPTDRWVEICLTRSMNCDDGGNPGSVYWLLALDGTDLVQTEIQADAHWTTKMFNYTIKVAAGTHTVAWYSRWVGGSTIHYHYTTQSINGHRVHWPGAIMDVYDRGVAA